MYVQYGLVTMSMIDTNEVKREQILTSDDTDYQYTKWTIDINCLYSPASATVNYAGDFPTSQVNPVKQGGNVSPFGVGQGATGGALPNLTDRSIRHYLFQPRRQLTIWSDFNGQSPFLILQSPSPIAGSPPRGPCSPPDVSLPDELNGPFVEACDVVECKGVRSWWVRIRIVTYVNECAGQFSQNSLNPILTHRWKRYVDTDQDYFTTLITEGEVVFRPAVMITTSSWPDQYRANFFPPIDPTMRRDKIEVIPSSNGTTVNYRVVDRELTFSIGKGSPATRIECFQTSGFSRGSNWSALGEGIRMMLEFNLLNPTAPLDRMERMMAQMTPKMYSHVIVKAWGSRLGARKRLLQLALGIAFTRIGPYSMAFSTELIATQEVTGKYVEVLMTYRSGPEQAIDPAWTQQGIIDGIADGFTLLGEGQLGFADDTVNIPGILLTRLPGTVPVTISQGTPVGAPFNYVFGNPPPPYSNASRGTWRGKLVAQALANPCGCQMPLGPNNPASNPVVFPAQPPTSIIIYDSNGNPVSPTNSTQPNDATPINA